MLPILQKKGGKLEIVQALMKWSVLNATTKAVWLPLIYSVCVIVFRFKQGTPFAWWTWCLVLGTPLGMLSTEWVPGRGLYMLPGFFMSYLVWTTFISTAPHRWSSLMRCSRSDLARFLAATDPLMISAGVFMSALIVDIIQAYMLGASGVTGWGASLWFYGIGGAGFGDVLFGSTAISFGLFACVQWMVIFARRFHIDE